MDNYLNPQLDRIFSALSDPTRRAMLARLETAGSQSVSSLAEPFPLRLPSVMKHLDVLNDAGLVRRSKRGRVVTVEITPEPMAAALAWLERYERFWSQSLDRLAALVEEAEE